MKDGPKPRTYLEAKIRVKDFVEDDDLKKVLWLVLKPLLKFSSVIFLR